MTSSAPRCVRTATAIPSGASTISGTMHGHDDVNADQSRSARWDSDPVATLSTDSRYFATANHQRSKPVAAPCRTARSTGMAAPIATRPIARSACRRGSQSRQAASASQMTIAPPPSYPDCLTRTANAASAPAASRSASRLRLHQIAKTSRAQAAGSADRSSPFAANPSMRGPTESTATSAPATRPVRRSATRATSSATTLARPAPHAVASARTAQACGPNRSNAPRYRRSRPCGRSTQTSR